MAEVKNPSVYVGGVKVAECLSAELEFDLNLPDMTLGAVPFTGVCNVSVRIPRRKRRTFKKRARRLAYEQQRSIKRARGHHRRYNPVKIAFAGSWTDPSYRITKITRRTDSETEFDAERIDK